MKTDWKRGQLARLNKNGHEGSHSLSFSPYADPYMNTIVVIGQAKGVGSHHDVWFLHKMDGKPLMTKDGRDHIMAVPEWLTEIEQEAKPSPASDAISDTIIPPVTIEDYLKKRAQARRLRLKIAQSLRSIADDIESAFDD